MNTDTDQTDKPLNTPNTRKRDEMALPDGFTCDSCFAFNFCVGFGVSKSGQTRCDWFPVRYRLDVRALSPQAREIVNSLVAETAKKRNPLMTANPG